MTLPPGPTRSPLANLRRFTRQPYGVFWDAAAEYGPVFSFRVTGLPAWVSVGEPELIEGIFRGPSEGLHDATDGLRYMLPPGALVQLDGEAHQRARELSLPSFCGERMPACARSIAGCVDAAVERLQPGQHLRLDELLGAITTRTTVECMFGIRDAERRDRLVALIEANSAHQRSLVWPIASMMLGGERVRGLIDASLRLGRRNPLPFARTELDLRALLQAETDAELHAQLSVLLGGLDTSAFTLAWAIWFLLTHRYAREHVLEEIERHGEIEQLEASPNHHSSWITAVIDETLRIRPIAHHTARRLSAPLELGPWSLPAGTYALPSQAVAHFRADLWKNPHEFRPERFLSEPSPSPFVYFPFGGGAQTCPARSFALMQMRVILSRLLERVELRLAARADPRPALRGLLIGPSDGVPVVVDRLRPAQPIQA